MSTIEKYLNSAEEQMIKVLAEDGSCVCYTAERFAEIESTPPSISVIPPVEPSAEPAPSDTITPAQPDEVAPTEGTTNVS